MIRTATRPFPPPPGMARADSPSTDPSPVERLFAAVREGRHEEVRSLLAESPELVRAWDPDPWCCRGTLLNVAVGRNDRTMIDLLLEAGADIDRKSDWWAGGFAPIHSVPRQHRPGLTRYLLERGATVDVHAAADHGLVDRLTELLDEFPDRVNQPGGDGGRPLHFAASPEVARLLLDRGAVLDPRDVDHGSTPAQWAVRDRPEVTAFLLDQGAAGDIFMYAAIDDIARVEAALDSDPTAARAVLDRGFFPSPGSRAGHIYVFLLAGYGSTVLHVAAAYRRLRVATLLLDTGADPDARGGYDDATPLHLAAWEGCADMVEILVRRGASIDAESGPEHRGSPLQWALVNGKHEAVGRLLELGASVKEEHRRLAAAGRAGELDVGSGTPEDFARIEALLDRHGGSTGGKEAS